MKLSILYSETDTYNNLTLITTSEVRIPDRIHITFTSTSTSNNWTFSIIENFNYLEVSDEKRWDVRKFRLKKLYSIILLL